MDHDKASTRTTNTTPTLTRSLKEWKKLMTERLWLMMPPISIPKIKFWGSMIKMRKSSNRLKNEMTSTMRENRKRKDRLKKEKTSLMTVLHSASSQVPTSSVTSSTSVRPLQGRRTAISTRPSKTRKRSKTISCLSVTTLLKKRISSLRLNTRVMKRVPILLQILRVTEGQTSWKTWHLWSKAKETLT